MFGGGFGGGCEREKGVSPTGAESTADVGV